MIALVKRGQLLDITGNISQQVQLISLPDTRDTRKTFESLYSVIHHTITPFFTAVTNFGSEGCEMPLAIKRISELESSLLQLQKDVEIPEIILPIAPQIQEVVLKHGENATADHLGDLAQDSTFLNRLQADVNGWIKEIQKVTSLERDVSSAHDEVNFWLSMEKTLFDIEAKLNSITINLTLDVLKNAKRYHATLSFSSDTGLKECLEKVQKYNLIMKDLPLNDLLFANDLEKIFNSIPEIFGHLNKKLKLSPYPIKRALSLVEAISDDLKGKLIETLSKQRLLFIPFNEFMKLMDACESIFHSWDDHVKEFTTIAREMTRKRSEKFIPIKITAHHQKLRSRIDFVLSFRKQHEQFYSIFSQSSLLEEVTSSAKNILENFDLAYLKFKDIRVLDLTLGMF